MHFVCPWGRIYASWLQGVLMWIREIEHFVSLWHQVNPVLFLILGFASFSLRMSDPHKKRDLAQIKVEAFPYFIFRTAISSVLSAFFFFLNLRLREVRKKEIVTYSFLQIIFGLCISFIHPLLPRQTLWIHSYSSLGKRSILLYNLC